MCGKGGVLAVRSNLEGFSLSTTVLIDHVANRPTNASKEKKATQSLSRQLIGEQNRAANDSIPDFPKFNLLYIGGKTVCLSFCSA